jgi:hypothetical protein
MMPRTASDSRAGSVTTAPDRRRATRYGVVAIAELTESEDGKLLAGTITQISRSGCYVESPKTLPVGTSLKVIISRDQETFVTNANVIHVQEQMGMGVAFLDTAKDQMDILNSWLADLPSVLA